jgi:hypothetical protein
MKTIESPEREQLRIRWLTSSLEGLIAEARTSGRLSVDACEILAQLETLADRRHGDWWEDGSSLEHSDEGAQERERGSGPEAERRHLTRMRIQLLGALGGEPLCVRGFLRAASASVELQRAHLQRQGALLV